VRQSTGEKLPQQRLKLMLARLSTASFFRHDNTVLLEVHIWQTGTLHVPVRLI
jgi:hypothetical protein